MPSSRFNARRNSSKSIKKSMKNPKKLTKIGPKSVLEALLGHPAAIFPPRPPQDRKKRPKRRSRTPPPGSKLGPKIDAKSTPKPSKRNTFLHSFSDRVLTPPGTDFHRIRVRKWSKNRPKIDVQSDLAENAKSLKNFKFS